MRGWHCTGDGDRPAMLESTTNTTRRNYCREGGRQEKTRAGGVKQNIISGLRQNMDNKIALVWGMKKIHNKERL